MLLKFIRTIEVKRFSLFNKSITTTYKLHGTEQNSELTLSEFAINLYHDNHEFTLEDISKFLAKPKFEIRNSISNLLVGEIVFNGGGANPFWEDNPSDPNAQIQIDNITYNFRDITSWQSSGFFNRNRNKIYNFKLYSKKGNEYINYQINIKIPIFRKPNFFTSVALEGEVEINTSNKLLPLVGFFLIQKSFEYENQRNSE